MYGKVFDSMYTGTLYGQWQAIVTFQQMIVLCDADGIIDMTPPGISGLTSIPLEIIEKGIAVLSEPDPYTRTPGSEGRRIELIDAHRPWGWRIVNHEKYKTLQDSDTVRAQTRERVRRHREQKRLVTDRNAPKRHTDTDTNTDTRTSKPSAADAARRPPKAVNSHKISFDPESAKFKGITEADELRWQDAFPAVPIPPEIDRAAAWAKANPANKKSNWEKFLVNWFGRAQDRAPRLA